MREPQYNFPSTTCYFLFFNKHFCSSRRVVAVVKCRNKGGRLAGMRVAMCLTACEPKAGARGGGLMVDGGGVGDGC